jgi:hypothetical protein
MRIPLRVLIWLLAAPLLVAAGPAVAQSHPPDDSTINFGGMLAKKAPTPMAPDVPAPPMTWPVLNRGAVLCRSEDDLLRRAAVLSGEQAGPADCRPITASTAIQILQRAGPGRTEVKLTVRGETGWTDAWLPATPPRGFTPVTSSAGGQAAGATTSNNR